MPTVYQHVLDPVRQPSHRFRHRLQARLQNVDAVNLLRRYECHCIRPGRGPNLHRHARPLRRRQLLGIGQALDAAIRRQHHGGGSNRAGQRAPPRLVHPCNAAKIRQGRQ